MSTLPDFMRTVANTCQRPLWKTTVGSLIDTCGSGALFPGPTPMSGPDALQENRPAANHSDASCAVADTSNTPVVSRPRSNRAPMTFEDAKNKAPSKSLDLSQRRQPRQSRLGYQQFTATACAAGTPARASSR